jgi:ADP-ribosylglycohydrolase
MPDLETLITETIERAVLKAFGEVFSTLPSGLFSSPAATSDDEVMGVPALAEYLGIGQRQAYQLVVRGAVRRWLEEGGESTIAPMRIEIRKMLNQRRQVSR